MMNFLFYLVMVLFIFVCFLLIMLVLIQKNKGGGLSSAFGGGGGGNTAFGTKTGDVLTWATSILFGVFILLAIFLNLISNYRQRNPDPGTKTGKQSIVCPIHNEQKHLG